MKNITLLAVNWNQNNATALMLKSYVKHHYTGEPLSLLLLDNGSTDSSRDWYRANDVPFIALENNVGHENGVNVLYEKIRTKYALLVDTDVEFTGNIANYLELLRDNCVAVSEYVHNPPLRPRLGPWFLLFDAERAKQAGVTVFRECAPPHPAADNSYDVGGWFMHAMERKGCEQLP